MSVLKGQKETFFFDVSNPESPSFISSADPPLSAITDEFYPLPGGGFLVTMMGGANGAHPGRVAEFNRHLELVSEYPGDPPHDGFNPHGISVRPEINLMVVKTITLPGPAGTIDVKLIPGDHRARAYTAGMADDKLYLVDPVTETAKVAFDFGTIAQGGAPQLMRMTRDGSRLFISMNGAGKIVMFDTSKPHKPEVLKVLDLGAGSGPHYLALTDDEKRLIVSDYFLNEDDFGKVHAEGDHKIHVARVFRNNLVLDPRFQLDFKYILQRAGASATAWLSNKGAKQRGLSRTPQSAQSSILIPGRL